MWWSISFPCCTMEQFTRQLPWPSEIKSVDSRCCRIFLFCWAPISVLQLLEVYRVFDNRSFKNAFLISIWCAMAQISSSSLSPVICAFLSPEFRKSLLKHCYFCCSHHVSTGGRQHCPLGRVEPVIWHRRIAAENHQNITFSTYVLGAWQFLELLRRGLSTESD